MQHQPAASKESALPVGTPVELLISLPYDWKRRQQPEPEWFGGYRIVAVRGARDRAFRYDVDGPKPYIHCAPECVRAVTP